MSGPWTRSNRAYTLFGTTMVMPPRTPSYPQVLLFDIGGVCVVSPMQAVLDYETANNLPVGWINTAISAGEPNAAWQRLERGDILLDARFFAEFAADLSNPDLWRAFHAQRNIVPVPDPPRIDSERLYWDMMGRARTVDPNIFPALERLRAVANATRSGQRPGPPLILGALSNTSIFPPGHPYLADSGPEGLNRGLHDKFDVFVSSAHVGMRKPDEDIYRYALTRLHEFVKLNELGPGVRPQDVTFLDDIGGNLRTAKRLGMNTIKVELGRTEKAVAELEKITGLQLRDDKARL